MRNYRVYLAIGQALIFLIAGVSHIAADVAVCDAYYYETANGWWVYEYSLHNPGTASDDLYWFELTELDLPVVQGIPTGWFSYADDYFVEWDADSGYEVTPGNNLDGFAIHSIYGPASVDYTVFGDVAAEYSGSIIGPVIPEPGTITLLSIGLAAMGTALRRRRRFPKSRPDLSPGSAGASKPETV